MTEKTKHIVITFVMVAFFLSVSVFAWLKPEDEFSLSERRKLSQFPELSFKTVVSGDFMSNFENYTLDQFPLRDKFRTLKAMVNLNIFKQSANNDIYVVDGFASKIEYPLNEASVERAGDRFQYVYEKYLKNSTTKNYLSIIPDKNYFLGRENGYLSIDYEKMISLLRENTGFLTYIDITKELKLSDFYKTDTHWREEELIDVAEKIGNEMGTDVKADYQEKALDVDFYGVYYGQSALPLEAEKIKYLTNETFKKCQVYDFQNGKEISVYDMEKANGKDPYEMFLGGPLSLVTIENENAKTNKELIIFRDSFGSSIAPLLVEGYKKITLVDIRYIHPNLLENYIEFNSQDVLFLYSTSVLNNSETIK
ncbi:MAG: hypothetical protein IJN94_04135 [Clostridia bacterium]|nr:hypothetical protein [Clostridia bacterium]